MAATQTPKRALRRATSYALVLLQLSTLFPSSCHGFSTPPYTSNDSCSISTTLNLAVDPPPGGFTVDEETANGVSTTPSIPYYSSMDAAASSSSTPMKRVGINSRGAKMNEIDFTLAPSDVSLSRCYQMSRDGASGTASASASVATTPQSMQAEQEQRVQTLSLTRALNTASNRAVRRILLARSWPSAEALNLSLRTVLMQQQQQEQVEATEKTGGGDNTDKAKCPVPRPILNILTKRRSDVKEDPAPRTGSTGAASEKEQQWIETQINVFRESYGSIAGYDQAEAYLECILNLATSGEESTRVKEVMDGGIYVVPYRRILSVIQSVGAVLEPVPDSTTIRKRITPKLLDQDICLSMLDKIALSNEKVRRENGGEDASTSSNNPVTIPYDAAAWLAYDSDNTINGSMSFDDFKKKYEAETVAMVTAKKKARDDEETQQEMETKKKEYATKVDESEPKGAYEKGRKRRLLSNFFLGGRKDESPKETETVVVENTEAETATSDESPSYDEPTPVIKPDDLGGVLLSAEEPTMTRQLNILSNIVQRTLIFGGDQELLVLSETLDADKPAFIQRWYKNNPVDIADIKAEIRPGVQFLNALIQLLRDCYTKGVIYDVNPTLPLSTGYLNAYGRLTASLIELGSGYVRPSPNTSSLSLALNTPAATAKYLTSSPPPKSAKEEFGRFAKWESSVRKNRTNPYPEDLVGTWKVEDMIGGSVIGTTQVSFKPQGEVSVLPPMQGLRWRLDPGPTHLDTCTFQVLSDDGAILQYKGFVDRGSRFEARVSKRSVSMRGGVSFLMRDAEMSVAGNMGDDYYDDILPMNYKNGQTKFKMSRVVKGGGSESLESSTRSAESDV